MEPLCTQYSYIHMCIHSLIAKFLGEPSTYCMWYGHIRIICGEIPKVFKESRNSVWYVTQCVSGIVHQLYCG